MTRLSTLLSVLFSLTLLLGAVACDSDSDSEPAADTTGTADTVNGDDTAGGQDVLTDEDVTTQEDVAAEDDVATDDDTTSEDDVAGEDPLAIIGEYSDDWGTAHTITADEWTQVMEGMAPSVFHISQYANDEGWLVAQNDADNEWSPELWSRFDWMVGEDALWFCQTRFDAGTEQEAVDAEPADASAPAEGGCAGYPWSQITPTDASK